MRSLVVLLVFAGCGGGSAPRPADAPVVPNDGPFVVSTSPYAPATIRFRTGKPLASFGTCEHAGQTIPYAAQVIVDDCVECQCTSYGLRCRKRPNCPDDRCVFADGQVVPNGGTAIVDTCHECVCGVEGPACRRRLEAPCPAAACKLADEELGIGMERFVSECHACTCDADAGLQCEDLCHPNCFCSDDQVSCKNVCAEHPCPLDTLDQERVELACGSLVCDYGDLVGCGQ